MATKLLYFPILIIKMTTVYLVLEVSALLLLIVLPLAGPNQKKSKKTVPLELSDWAIDETGNLQSFARHEPDHHHAK